jgi:hypothetical protein
VLDEISTVSYGLLHQLTEEITFERMYWFGDHRQLPPILGQHLLDDVLGVRPALPCIGYLTQMRRSDDRLGLLLADMWACHGETEIERWLDRLHASDRIIWKESDTDVDIDAVVQALLLNAPSQASDSLPLPLIMSPTVAVVDRISESVRCRWQESRFPDSFQQLQQVIHTKTFVISAFFD